MATRPGKASGRPPAKKTRKAAKTTRAAHFGPELFHFLRELAINNERAWFEANRARYESDVKAPMLRFISDFGPVLEKISRRYVADPRPVGGSLFRIYRDTRFSKDKTPYKTQASAHFRHEKARDVHAPGFYLHLEPGNVFGGFGLWHPEADVLQKVRGAIATRPERWRAVLSDPAFAATCTLGGESLSRPPRGFEPEHPLIDEIKRKDFVAMTSFSEKLACSPGFIDAYAEACRTGARMMEFLTRAIGLDW